MTTEGNWFKTLTGQNVRVKTPGAATEHRLTVLECVEPPHSTPPVFTRHAFIEIFFLIHGALTFQFLDEDNFVIDAGQMVTVPSYTPHSFWNESDNPALIMLICTPAGLDRFFEASDQLLRGIREDRSNSQILKAAMIQLRKEYGLEHVAPPPKSPTSMVR